MTDDLERPPALLEKHKGTPRVSMSNALVRAGQDLSLPEKRLLMLAISKMDSGRHWTPKSLVIQVTAEEYRDAFALPHDKNLYRDLKAAAEALEERKIIFSEPNRKGERVHHVRWVGRATYAKGEGWIELSFTVEVAPHLFKLRRHFTTYHLKQAHALHSVYSWRLLELLMQFRATQRLNIPLEKFHHAMDVPPSLRKSYKDLRRRVIAPAIKELQAKDDLQVEVTPRKTGRKVTSLAFTFGYALQRRLPLE